jgi:phosphoglycolate phosphatase-like HAD superfamily hydrolase
MSYSCLLLDVDNTLIDTRALDVAVSERDPGGPDACRGRRLTCVPGWRRHVRLWDEETPRVLAVLEARGVRLGIVSDAPRRYVIAVLEATGVRRFFGESVITAGAGVLRKPSGVPLQRALARLGHPVDGALYVGDAPGDAMACRRAGIHFGLAGWAWREGAWEGEEPDVAVRRFDDLLGLCPG